MSTQQAIDAEELAYQLASSSPDEGRLKLLLYSTVRAAILPLHSKNPDIDDIIQDTYIAVWGKYEAGKLEPKDNAMAYVMTAARNTAKTILSKRRVEASKLLPLPKDLRAGFSVPWPDHRAPVKTLSRSCEDILQMRLNQVRRQHASAEPEQRSYLQGMWDGFVMLQQDYRKRVISNSGLITQ